MFSHGVKQFSDSSGERFSGGGYEFLVDEMVLLSASLTPLGNLNSTCSDASAIRPVYCAGLARRFLERIPMAWLRSLSRHPFGCVCTNAGTFLISALMRITSSKRTRK
jgi:hypothetical protein